MFTELTSAVSRWWKKCPLRRSHWEQTLLSGEKALYLFASDGFAKVQWYSALLWGAQPEGGVPRAVEHLYESFCASVRAVTTVPHLLPAVRASWLRRMLRPSGSREMWSLVSHLALMTTR